MQEIIITMNSNSNIFFFKILKFSRQFFNAVLFESFETVLNSDLYARQCVFLSLRLVFTVLQYIIPLAQPLDNCASNRNIMGSDAL